MFCINSTGFNIDSSFHYLNTSSTPLFAVSLEVIKLEGKICLTRSYLL